MSTRNPNAHIVTALALSAACLLGLLWPWNAAQAIPDESAGCLEQAAIWADVHPTLLRAIAWVESRGNPHALNWNRNGSYDVGLMQINSRWYHHGLKIWWKQLGQPCVSVAAAAWVLRQCVETHRYTWDAVGCYHAGEGWKREPKRAIGQRYIRRVQETIRRHGKAEQQKRVLVHPHTHQYTGLYSTLTQHLIRRHPCDTDDSYAC